MVMVNSTVIRANMINGGIHNKSVGISVNPWVVWDQEAETIINIMENHCIRIYRGVEGVGLSMVKEVVSLEIQEDIRLVEVDLHMVGVDLPMVVVVDLPMVGVDLPMVGVDLPMVEVGLHMEETKNNMVIDQICLTNNQE